ncbi:hypothetical protein HZA99_04790 [Candidatus Woesearchaeota archaeon]|nr:hypothetical protein [Candidatus Woesearchaeota archaeon]
MVQKKKKTTPKNSKLNKNGSGRTSLPFKHSEIPQVNIPVNKVYNKKMINGISQCVKNHRSLELAGRFRVMSPFSDRGFLTKRIKIKLKEIPALFSAKKEEKKHLVSDKELSSEQHLFEKYALSLKKFILKGKGKRKK